jgi:hypothetical protein
MNNRMIVLFGILLASCRGFSSSSVVTTSSLPVSISTSFTNSLFDKSIPEGTLLKETLESFQFNKVNVGMFSGTPLNPINFFENTALTTPFAGESVEVGDYAQEVISFSNVPLNLNEQLGPFIQPTSYQQETFLTLLEALKITDEPINEMERTLHERDLSFDVLGDPYYWFNNYVKEERIVLTRYQDPILYGEGTIHIEFQTGINIQPVFVEQISFNDQYIYSIVDQTFPTGFFGAVDTKIVTIRQSGNAKEALTIGPIQQILNTIWNWQRWQNNVLTNQPSATITAQDFMAIRQSNHQLMIQMMIEMKVGEQHQKRMLQATIDNHQWTSFEKSHLIWIQH